MTLLKKIKIANDKGIIGITESGEEVPLSEPCPSFVSQQVAEGGYDEANKLKDYFIKEVARKKDASYYQIGEPGFTQHHAILPFNRYAKREIA